MVPDYERRPDTDRAASDARAAEALAGVVDAPAVSLVREDGRAPYLRDAPAVRALGLGIRPELVREQRLDLRGRVIANAHDLALAQIIRNPGFETRRGCTALPQHEFTRDYWGSRTSRDRKSVV